ncbi:unnamed protein product [Caenorhabditis angaria]|uniref:Tyrosine-protein kinase n=1 Tax=Caenorhabditis angaria TaxID=860376 RepID=A0A9P1IL82_9PELO|nr:unnamed protein product [Caenorhabditis angaria]
MSDECIEEDNFRSDAELTVPTTQKPADADSKKEKDKIINKEEEKKFFETKDIVEDESLFKSIQELSCYHGFLPREDLKTLLQNEGDYLIRVSEIATPHGAGKNLNSNPNSSASASASASSKDIKRDLILSVFECPENQENEGKEGKLRNLVVRRYKGRFGIEISTLFENINELLQHYQHSNTSPKKNRLLKTPIPMQKWEFKHSDILRMGSLLGEGAYGEVRAGVLKRKGREIEVAVKLMKGGDLNKIKIREMMQEARLMRAFKHNNVVRFYGVAVDEQPLHILLELVKGGGLNSYLRKNKKQVTPSELLNICHGAALGLEYLHSNNCIHRDIAARNCLYSIDKIVKLSDFGLSRIGSSYKLTATSKLPIKWLAAETISTLMFTPKTDVYSYGVMCFEIFAEGEEPWQHVTNVEVKKYVVSGRYLQIPDSCPEKLKVFINEKIYVADPKKRAGMREVLRVIENEIIMMEEREREKEREKEKEYVPLSNICGTRTPHKHQHQHIHIHHINPIPNPHHRKLNKKSSNIEFE